MNLRVYYEINWNNKKRANFLIAIQKKWRKLRNRMRNAFTSIVCLNKVRIFIVYIYFIGFDWLWNHSREIKGLCLMKCSIEIQIGRGEKLIMYVCMYYYEMKGKKNKYLYFCIEKYQMANLDVFQWNISSSINLFFLKSEIHSWGWAR